LFQTKEHVPEGDDEDFEGLALSRKREFISQAAAIVPVVEGTPSVAKHHASEDWLQVPAIIKEYIKVIPEFKEVCAPATTWPCHPMNCTI
jgi:hypothetical protein